jgi:tetratricopeptide (TPR) repeat protein
MRTCPICGSTIEATARFCPSCGSATDLSCPSCATAVEDSWHFCPVCSDSLLRLCPSCGTFVSVTARFCKACGWTLDADETIEPLRQPAAVLVAAVDGSFRGEAPPQLRPLVAGAISAAQAAAESGGIVQRLVGNRLRVVFGVPTPGEADAVLALHVAAEIVRAVQALAPAAQEMGASLDVRVGVDAGVVVVPDPTSAQPVVAGDPAVAADRMARLAPRGGILVGEGAAGAVDGDLSLGRGITIDLGAGKTIHARRLLLPGDVDQDPARWVAAEAAQSASPAAEYQTLERLGDEHAAAGMVQDALDAYHTAIAAARSTPDLGPEWTRLAVKVLSLVVREEGPAPPDPAPWEQLVDAALQDAPEGVVHAWLLALKGACGHLWAGRDDDPVPVEERIRLAEQARSAAEPLGDLDLLTFVGGALDQLYWTSGEYARAVESARWQLRIAEHVTTPRQQADLLLRAAFTILYTEGNFGEVAELANRAEAIARDLDPHTRMHATFLMMSAAYYRGRWNELRPALEAHLEAFSRDGGSSCPSARGGPALGALTFAQMGDVDGARRLASLVGYDPATPETGDGILSRYAVSVGEVDTGRRMAEAVLAHADDPDATLALVEALVAQQDWEGVREFVPSARSIGDGMATLIPACDRAEGLAEAWAGKRWSATELLKGALGGFERLSVPFEAARTREALAGITGAEESRDYLEHAVSSYERLGAAPSYERARGRLARVTEEAERVREAPAADDAAAALWSNSWPEQRRTGT